MMDTFMGLKVIISANAVERIVRWPDKKRSRRLIKKMTKRLGPQFWYKPVAFQTPNGLVVHPEIYAEMQRRSRNNSNVAE